MKSIITASGIPKVAGLAALFAVASFSTLPSYAADANVIGTQEAPTVLNVVPWKDREVKLEKKDPTSSLLNRVLEPLDQEVLMREIEYHQLLTQEPDNDGLFLD